MKKKSIISALIVLMILTACSGCLNHSGTEGGSERFAATAVISGLTVEATAEQPSKDIPPETAAGTTEEPAPEQEEAPEREQPFLVQITDEDPSIAYVLVRMPNPIGLLPLPLDGEYKKTIRRIMADGTEAVNVLHLTPNGFRMEDANCEGHDCIQEGEVTLENREERILWNMVICLPHQLSLELITREEAEQMIR